MYAYPMEYYLALTKYPAICDTEGCEDIMLSEIVKNNHFHVESKNTELMKAESRMVVTRLWVVGKLERCCLRGWMLFEGRFGTFYKKWNHILFYNVLFLHINILFPINRYKSDSFYYLYNNICILLVLPRFVQFPITCMDIRI